MRECTVVRDPMTQELNIGDGIGAGGGCVTPTAFARAGRLDSTRVSHRVGFDLGRDDPFGFNDAVSEGQREAVHIVFRRGRQLYHGLVMAGDFTVLE